ncbi:fatty acid synthase alpha subunit Lsd1, partial [Linderina pennispora]
PLDVLDANTEASCIPSDGKPSPMVSIRGVPLPALEKLIAQFNSCYLSPTDHVYLALINAFDLFVVTGRLTVVTLFVQFLRQHCAEPSADQSDIPFSQRKPVADISYVNSSVVTHCRLLQTTGDWLPGFVVERDWSYHCGDTQVIPPVKVNGVDISSGVNLEEMVAQVIFTRCFDWPSTLKGADATHIIDFSPGGFSVFARLARSIVDGSGVNIISCSSLIAHKRRLLGSKADLFQRDIRSVVQSMNWRRAFGPKLVQVKSSSQIHINSPMFHALGYPPVMVSAVEPSATSVQLVAAAINAGYHAELSTTRIVSTFQLQKQVADLVQLIEPGQDIALCCDYSNQEQWATLFPEILRMRQAGQPIAGLSISGSIPTAAAAADIIADMRDAGLRHITFKAATLADIRATIAISKVDRKFPVILQWMGGRNGGYHSWDDFYQPILDSYSLLRFHRNVVLIAGSGIGDADTAMQYISGDWSVPFGRPPMPFDGVALGSCVIAAKESDLSNDTKQLITDTAGVGPNEWMDTYSGVAGGVTSITGENGKPMHVIATRAALFIKELQGSIFSQPADKQTELLQRKRDSIIQRLNSDYIKPWFGKKADGSVAELQDMTYLETIHRLVELMYVDDSSCWINSSLCLLVYDFVKRVEDRFSGCVREYFIRHQLELGDPLTVARDIERVYPDVASQPMATEDVQYFIVLCKRSGQSSVPFVPVLDGDLEMWMLQGAVSLSMNGDYVISHDVQRQLVPYGPVSTGYSSTANAPVGDILDGVYQAMVHSLYKNSPTTIPATEYIGAEPKLTTIQSAISSGIMGTGRLYTLSSDNESIPDTDPWLELLAGPKKSWLRALLTSLAIVQGTKFVANGVRRIMHPMSNQSVSISESDGIPQKLEVFDSQEELNIVFEYVAPSNITVRVILPANGGNRELVLKFLYCPTRPAMPITEVMDGRDRRIHEFYFGRNSPSHATLGDIVDSGMESPVIRCQLFDITEAFVTSFFRNFPQMQNCCRSLANHHDLAPLDMLFLIGWQGLMAVLENQQLSSGLLDMVHLENSMDYID